VSHIFTLMASSGKSYTPTIYDAGGWSADLPAGSYRAVHILDCLSSADEGPFVVTAGTTLQGVVIHYGCDVR
jgi:hypothetical protein